MSEAARKFRRSINDGDFGFAISSSEMPIARHCARRPAQRAVPGLRLLRSCRGMSHTSACWAEPRKAPAYFKFLLQER